jgi:hypothetical protein
MYARQKSLSTAILTLNNHHITNLKMENELETTTIRLTSQIIRCIAKSLLVSAEELERSLWRYSTPTEHSQSPSECDDDALKL